MINRLVGAASAALLALAGGGCERAAPGPAPPHLPVKLLGPSVPAAEVLTSEVVLESRELRLDDPDTLAGIGFVGIGHQMTAEGLRLEPQTPDAFLLIDPRGPFNVLELEVQVAVDASFDVFWAYGAEAFGQERMKTVWLTGWPEFKRYRADLWAELDLRDRACRFRLNPVKQVPMTVRSLTLRRVIRLPPSSPLERPPRGKVSLAGDRREAAALTPGQRLSTRLDIHEDDVLTFALAGARDNDTPVLFQVLVEQPSKPAQVAWEELLPVRGPLSWTERRVPLGRFAGRDRRLMLSARERPAGGLGVAVALCAVPLVSAARTPQAPNLIVISLDTLGARHLTLYGGRRPTDRFLSRLAAEGTLFRSAFATSSVTDTSHASMLTGMAPFNSTSFWLDAGGRRPSTLAELLRQRGYVTAGLTAGVLMGRRQGFDRGFEFFHEEDTLFKPPAQRTDIERLLRLGEEWWARAAPPRFLFLHSYEPHGPYYWRPGFIPRPEDRSADGTAGYYVLRQMRGKKEISRSQIPDYVMTRTPGGGEATLAAMGRRSFDPQAAELFYESEIAFVDDQLRGFWARLSQQGLLENTLVIVTSDHGEAFFEHRLLEHGQLYAENLHVPLLLWGPRRVPAGLVVGDQVSTMDIVPTTLDLLGIAAEHSYDGRSLRRLLVPGHAESGVPFYAFVPENGFAWHDEGRYKYVLPAAVTQENFGRAELYDLRADPAETRNLLAVGRALPPSITQQVQPAIDAMPGIHLSLEEFAPGEYELETTTFPNPHQFYAFDLDLLDTPRLASKDVHRMRVWLKRGARLVAFGAPGENVVVLRLRTAAAGRAVEFTVEERTLSMRPTRIAAPGTGKALWARRGGGSGRVSAGPRFSREDWEKLRSLGYVR